MKNIIVSIGLLACSILNPLTVSAAKTIHYTDHEIHELINSPTSKQLSTDFIHNYYTSKQPDQMIEHIIQSDLSPLMREFLLFNLLTEISQQPPQNFHQSFVNQMKKYVVQSISKVDEGHSPQAVFNLNSKAYGIENIWTAYHTELKFNQMFAQDTELAVASIQAILAQESSIRRPQWLGIKNSIEDLSDNSKNSLVSYLRDNISINSGLDHLISHVGLKTGNSALIDKSLSSNLTEVREYTLRQLPTHLPSPQAKTILLKKSQSGKDQKFSTSMLSHFLVDSEVENHLINQLNNRKTAANAAFVLSQSDNSNLPSLLKKRFILSQSNTEKNHLLLSLKLNKSSDAKLVLDDLLNYIEKDSSASKWLKSFEKSNVGAH